MTALPLTPLVPAWPELTPPAVCGTPMPVPVRTAADCCISGPPAAGVRRSGCDVLLPLLAALLGRRRHSSRAFRRSESATRRAS